MPQVRVIAEQLVAYHRQFHDLFARREQRQWSLFYLRGQLSDLPRKTVEPMVLALRGHDPAAVRAAQTFLGEGAWDDTAIVRRHQELVAQSLGEPDGVVIVDGSSFPKQGKCSVGVARQYCGRLGKVANCQHGVFAAYCSSKGATLVDCRLYLPERWFDADHAPRRVRCGVPKDLAFVTEPKLALQMVRSLHKRSVLPFSYVLGDEAYGLDPKFVDGVEALEKTYFVEVPKTTRVYLGPVRIVPPGPGKNGRPRKHPRSAPGTPPPLEVQHVAASLAPSAWTEQLLQEGTKGPLCAQIACVQVTRTQRLGRPGAAAWLVLRRGLGPDSPLKMFLTNAKDGGSPESMGRLSALRWPIETVLEECKSEVGMDQYEVRSYRGWYHQMTQSMLAHHFLVRLRLSQKKKVLR